MGRKSESKFAGENGPSLRDLAQSGVHYLRGVRDIVSCFSEIRMPVGGRFHLFLPFTEKASKTFPAIAFV